MSTTDPSDSTASAPSVPTTASVPAPAPAPSAPRSTTPRRPGTALTPSRPAPAGPATRPSGSTKSKKKGKKGKKNTKKKGLFRGHPLRWCLLGLAGVLFVIFALPGLFGGMGSDPHNYSIPTQIGLMPGGSAQQGICILAHQAGGKASSDDIESACTSVYRSSQAGIAANCRADMIKLVKLAWKDGNMIPPDYAQVDQACDDQIDLKNDGATGVAFNPIPLN